MKAQQYFDQFRENEKNKGFVKAAKIMFTNLIEEIPRQARIRNARTSEAITAIAQEQNNKWKKICDLAEKEKGEQYFNIDGFKELAIKALPDLAEKFKALK